ncbi:MAG: hypothetical protein CFE45_28925 [Burkholderiales bacterium PBB5]|nr:MAG: hypothetical protein CFE45_28925 [Burkholderiales bacterium PBB5]
MAGDAEPFTVQAMRSTLSRGFTLIEQLAVITAVGAASVTAVPALLSVRDDASSATLSTLASTLSVTLQLNLAACQVTGQQAVADKCLPVQDCQQVAQLLNGGLPAGYAVLPQALGDGAPGANGVAGQCTLQQASSGASQHFVGVSAGH